MARTTVVMHSSSPPVRKRDALSVGIKRLTFRKPGPIRLELVFHVQARGHRTDAVRSGREIGGFPVRSASGRSRRQCRSARDASSALLELARRRAATEVAVQARRADDSGYRHRRRDRQPFSSRRQRLAGPARWRPATVLQRDRHQGELALPALRFRHRHACRRSPSSATIASSTSRRSKRYACRR